MAQRRREPGAWVGPVGDRIDDVSRIAVLRGGGLGDLLFALPACSALAAAYPSARLTVLGTPFAAQLLPGRVPSVHEVELLPVAEGVHSPRGGVEDPAEVDAFVERLRGRFDLAVQVHGGGRYSNPFLARLEPRVSIGLRTPDAAALDRTVPYLYYQHEMLRGLEVAGLAGAPPVELEPSVGVLDEDAEGARRLLGEGTPVVVIHPGATDPRRRWPVEKFAETAARLVRECGVRIVVVGDGGDAEAAERITAGAQELLSGVPGAQQAVRSLAGRLTIGELVGVLAAAAVVLGNDSGPRHLAQAVGSATVGIYWLGNVINAGALGRSRHRVQLAWTTHCPVCGIDATQVGWTAPRCEHDVSFVADVAVDAVVADVADLLSAGAG